MDTERSFWDERQRKQAAATERRHRAERAPAIPSLTGRPNRETVICKDDILNLRIALSVAKDYDAFLAMV